MFFTKLQECIKTVGNLLKMRRVVKGTVKWRRRGAETGINRSILISWFVGKCSFSALKGHHHERSKNVRQRLNNFYWSIN
jgi:hypothetical protein